MRDVTPRDPAAVARLMDAEDGILRYVDTKFKNLQAEIFDLIADVSRGYWNRTVSELNRHERQIFDLEVEFREFRGKVRKKLEEEQSGRGVPYWQARTPLTPINHAAQMAA